MRRTEAQQFLHTQPSSGVSRTALHAAQVGASKAEIIAFADVLANADSHMRVALASRRPASTMVYFMREEPTVESGHSTTKLTYDDYVRFPEDGLRHEIIDGEHYVTPSPSLRHQRISGTLFYLLRTYLEKHPLGELFYAPFDALLGRHDIVVPDLLYLSEERRHFLTAKNLQGPPSLVIEILSPSTSRRDRQLKRDLYERVGVEEYWLVDPERDVVNIYRWGADGHESSVEYEKTATLTSSLFPGLELPLDRVFASG
jgi:Uma2 family endonuclease